VTESDFDFEVSTSKPVAWQGAQALVQWKLGCFQSAMGPVSVKGTSRQPPSTSPMGGTCSFPFGNSTATCTMGSTPRV
jgi:hypothetical protein